MIDEVVIQPRIIRLDEAKKENEGNLEMQIPQCCREHWDSCPHVVNKDNYKKKKINIAL